MERPVMRTALVALFALTSCTTTTTASARTASAKELTWAPTFSTADDTDALVFDFPQQKKLALSGRVSSWLGWLDTRSPKGTVESVPNLGALAAPIVTLKIGDGKQIDCALQPQQASTSLPREIFDAKLLEGAGDKLEGVQISLASTEVGTFAISLGGSQCVAGADVLSHLVVLIAQRGKQPLLILVPRE